MTFSGAADRPENRARIALIKRHVGVGDALTALDLVTEAGPECPACGAVGALKEIPPKGGGFLPKRIVSDASRCSSCEATFDAIDVVRAKTNMSLAGVLDFLERECLSKKSAKNRRENR